MKDKWIGYVRKPRWNDGLGFFRTTGPATATCNHCGKPLLAGWMTRLSGRRYWCDREIALAVSNTEWEAIRAH